TLVATNNVTVNGSLNANGLTSVGSQPTNGGLIDINASNGTVSVFGNLSANSGAVAGNGGTVHVQTVSFTPLTIDPASAALLNVVKGTITAQGVGAGGGVGGEIDVTNASLGGVTIFSAGNLNASEVNGPGGNISIATAGELTVGGGTMSVAAGG